MPNNKATGIAYSDPDLTLLSINGSVVSATAPELSTVAGAIASVSQVSTPAAGSNTTVFSFKDTAGNPVVAPRGMLIYISDNSGVGQAPITSIATQAGAFMSVAISIGSVSYFVTSPSGGVTILLTGSGPTTRYLTFVLPNGKLLISGPLVFN